MERTLKEKVRRSVTQEELGVEALVLHIKRSSKRPQGRPKAHWKDDGSVSRSSQESWSKCVSIGKSGRVCWGVFYVNCKQ